MNDVLNIRMIRKAVRILNRTKKRERHLFEGVNPDPWKGQEDKWAILLTESEIKEVVACLKYGLWAYRMDKATLGKNMRLIEKIIKSLGEIA